MYKNRLVTGTDGSREKGFKSICCIAHSDTSDKDIDDESQDIQKK